MKHFVLFFSLLGCCYVAGATIYYSRGVVAPNLLSSWNSNRLGGGATPASFINPGDEFVIQSSHVMYTSASWVVGSPSSALRIENGGILHATFSILLSGSFQILDGGIYYHDNIAAVTSGAGTSIFGGNELFSQASTVEIRKWINHTTPLPSSITWGNLVINYDINLGGNWNQQGVLTNIQGNFSIKRSGVAGQDFRLTNNVTLNLFVGGNMEIGSATLMVKDGNAIGSTAIVQVQGDITINDGILNLGFVDIKPNNEFRFKGNLFINGNGSITSQSEESLLVANNTGVQSVFSNTTINASIKIVPGARVKLNSPLVLGTLRALVVAGTLQAGTNAITMNGGSIVVPGGYFRSSNKINMKDGVCQVCQGNGSFSFANGWCAATGDTGVIEYNTDTILFNQSLASALRIGAQNSKGKLFLTNGAVIAFSGPATGPAPNRGSIELTGNGTLSFDETSMATGNAFYNGNGGWLSTGASSGLLSSLFAGNIQVTGSRNYNAGGINSFEFKSSLPQVTGNAFPSTITGTLKVSNTNPSGLSLSNAIAIATGGTLHLEKGTINTNNVTLLLTMNRNSILLGGSAASYVDGPLRKFGEQNFTFHVGRAGRYSPVVINANGGGNANDVYTVEYVPGNPQTQYGNQLFQLIDHISTVEHWLINGTPSPRQIRFTVTPYSGVTDFNSLVVGYFEGFGWINLGNGTVTGNTSNGTIEVSAVNYGPFTLASTSFLTNPFSTTVPVNFRSFSARRNGNKGVLNWDVTNETDADYFEVLASANTRNFTTVGTIQAINNKQKYQFIDPILKPGATYYRIRVVEKNGIVTLSKIAAIFFDVKGVTLLSASPSIVKQGTSLTIVSSGNTNAQVRIVDLQGRIVKLISCSIIQGTNTMSIDLGKLSAGLYYINLISAEGGSNAVRFMKE